MKYTITHSSYSNSEHTAAVITTREAGAILITSDDAELWGQMLSVVKPDPSPAMDRMVPASVSPSQAREALMDAGLLHKVDAALAAVPGDEGAKARIKWEFASSIDRNSPLVSTLGAALQLSTSELDDLFIAAGAL